MATGVRGPRRYAVRVGASDETRWLTMREARDVHARGELWSSHGSSRDIYAGTGRHPGLVTLKIDLTDMNRLAASYGQSVATMKGGYAAISRTINFGVRKLQTKLKYKVKEWTGISRVGDVTKGFKPRWSTAATLTGVLKVEDRHRTIGRDTFGARWGGRGDPGGTHHAWARPQIAVGSFMQPSQRSLMKRVGRSRKPIKPLYGPNFAREIERHRPEVQAEVNGVGILVQREAMALLRLALSGSRR